MASQSSNRLHRFNQLFDRRSNGKVGHSRNGRLKRRVLPDSPLDEISTNGGDESFNRKFDRQNLSHPSLQNRKEFPEMVIQSHNDQSSVVDEEMYTYSSGRDIFSQFITQEELYR
ncbi:uncharacterized protein LOC142337034 [Convolutriloba macropyga]|uniref:uncharacterized protein LOC142337034 n=1 Tax=Convolutriloba macropyga TaxID=536237 RepID=UPI003F52556B